MFEYNEIKILSHGLVFQISFFNKVNNVIYTLIETDNNSDIQYVLYSYTDDVEIYHWGMEFTNGIKKTTGTTKTL